MYLLLNYTRIASMKLITTDMKVSSNVKNAKQIYKLINITNKSSANDT